MPRARPLVHSPDAPNGSPTPCPNDDLLMLVELLRPAGPDLGRRWLAALLLAPEADRAAIVASVERRIAGMYGGRIPPYIPPGKSAPSARAQTRRRTG